MPATDSEDADARLQQIAKDAKSPTAASPSSYLGLNNDAVSPRNTSKSVSISREPEIISPLLLGEHKTLDSDLDLGQGQSPRRKLSTKGAASKRLSGRPPAPSSPSLKFNRLASLTNEATDDDSSTGQPRSSHHQQLEELIDGVSDWIKRERSKHAEKKSKHQHTDGTVESTDHASKHTSSHRRGSDASETSFDLNKLEDILKLLPSRHKRNRNRSPSSYSRKGSVGKLWRKQSSASSDNDHSDEFYVPSCNAVLDNSQTLQHAAGASSETDSSADDLRRTASYKDHDAWAKFKFEIVRLTHTLRLKGWRKVPMKMSNKIHVERLSGALTNSVYVVSPPTDLVHRAGSASNGDEGRLRKPPPKLLLRIYGPNVEHLIDREAELGILRRLAKKRIGPLLLGTFANGRFEEYFYASPLTPEEMRNPDTSRQIAKRMRELHDGVDLLDEERQAGAFVFRNWDKWVDRAEKIGSWLDCQIAKLGKDARPTGADAWKRRGHICLLPWKQFRAMVEKYRAWLEAEYGGTKGLNKQLIFAHNDTQYGNILRIKPTGESPLLLPANSHKQLIVIDFEYASANVRGLEFANHFTEWCYNYHDERKAHAFHASWYPTPEEQDRFVRAYVRHRPQYNVSTPKLGPVAEEQDTSVQDAQPIKRQTSSISDFMLDARTPSTPTKQQKDESDRKSSEDRDVAYLLRETRMWRLINSANWVAWGIVQAKVPGMPEFDDSSPADATEATPDGEEAAERKGSDGHEELYRQLTSQQGEEHGPIEAAPEEMDVEFDYLGYAQHRAMSFWADAILMGFLKEEDLAEEIRGKLKKVPY